MPTHSFPYGNAFIVDTPKIDELGKRLYQEQKQRELDNRNQIKSLDDEFSKNVSNIRDADVGDLAKLYGDYKTATIASMKQKGGVSPQQQLEILRKKADIYKLINDSKSEKDNEELYSKRYAIKPDDFNDNAGQMLINGRRLPLSQKRSFKTSGADGKETTIDLTNPDNLLYQDKINWQPILNKAGGTLKQRGNPVEKALPGGLETEVTTYKGANDPIEFYTNLVGSMNNARASKSLAARFPFTPEEAQNITTTFEALQKDPAFKNAYGEIKFPESSNLTEGTRTAKLLAMQNAINNPPTTNVTKRTDKSAVMDRQEGFRKLMSDVNFEHNKVLAGYRNYLTNLTYDKRREAINGSIDAYIDEQESNAVDGSVFSPNGAKTIKASPQELEAFKDHNTGYSPSKIQVLPNGDRVLMGGLMPNGKDEDPYPTRTITRDAYKSTLVNHLFNTTLKIGQTTKKTESKPTAPTQGKWDKYKVHK